MSQPVVGEAVRALGEKLKSEVAADLLGSREDRGEMTYWVMPKAWLTAVAAVRDSGFHDLSDLTAVDYLDREPRFDVMAILRCTETHEYVRLKTVLDEGVKVPSLCGLWAGARGLRPFWHRIRGAPRPPSDLVAPRLRGLPSAEGLSGHRPSEFPFPLAAH